MMKLSTIMTRTKINTFEGEMSMKYIKNEAQGTLPCSY